MIRSAKIHDAMQIAKIINQHAAKELMLPIPLNQIYEQLRDFLVVEKKGHVVGCGAIHVAWEELGEIRSLAVDSEFRHKGLGTILVQKTLEMAREIELKKIFVLTYQVKFFERFGFQVVDKSTLPHKIWKVCLNCHKFPDCDETAMMMEL